ncbi:tRNA glutamyl-Q(34) synthetase GluQRS [Larsenimonas rhizosphaerae]|uniref:tRNA glutamyl-Q(34) synthetase GluQRS n=1 Tax=Larsenimonas rhizosphaerae TaxID=2944682 RepID=UPI002033F50A|nr:tRNA glutamyl-Q(34) synthetase GluQRS [Larsenimonas rhizosphaerae]MCM2131579.1 tRNA glutamyl-Q(34) synthetase GluQRS [Larsenimonas rhizosphaerae]
MSGYVGRFAPTPSGPLHFGSLTTALASWLDARAVDGQWHVRIEDIDPPRCPPGTDTLVLKQLEAFGLVWDGPVTWQHDHGERYEAFLNTLVESGHAYPCGCSRKEWQAYGVYPGWCRHTPRHPERSSAWRLDVTSGPSTICWNDRRLGKQQWPLEPLGDVVLKRRDGLWAYQLAVVIDDAEQGITDVVRGVDLLDNTPWQHLLHDLAGYTPPRMLHLPLMLTPEGQKLSKQNLAPALDTRRDAPRSILHQALMALGQKPPEELMDAPVVDQLAHARTHWRISRLPGCNVTARSTT